jgi:hypothetical protein
MTSSRTGQLLGLWHYPFEHLLDYTSGETCCSQDQPCWSDRNGFDEPQEVDDHWALECS